MNERDKKQILGESNMVRLIIKENFSWMIILMACMGFGLLLPCVSPEEAYALSAEEYCQVAEKLLEISIQEITERNAVGSFTMPNQAAYLEHFETVARKYRIKRDQVFTAFSTTSGEYLRYGAEHRQSVNAFFENNPDKKNTIDSLSHQLEGLRTQYESQVKHP